MKKPENLFQHWWWIILCAILFAAAGNFFAALMPARYEQSTDFQILFKPNQSIDWTDKEMLALTETVGDLINDQFIRSSIIESLEAYALEDSDFSAYTGLEQRYYGWKLKVTTKDPALTEAFLEAWQTAVSEVIQHDLTMSQQTQQQRLVVAAWIPCLQLLPAEPMHPFCNPQNTAMMASQYNEAVDKYQSDREEILFLDDYPPAYSVTGVETSAVTRIPLIKQSTFIFTGLLTGLLIGTLTIQMPWTYHLNFKRGES